MVRTLKDLFAGAAGGIAQVLLGKFLCPPPCQKLSVLSNPTAFISHITCRGWGGVTIFCFFKGALLRLVAIDTYKITCSFSLFCRCEIRSTELS